MENQNLNPKENFTKGNWYFQTEADTYTNIIRCDKGQGDRTYFIGCFPHSQSIESQANAQLAAAAPDLFEACKLMLSRFENTDIGMVKADYVKDIARKAIKKALTIQEKGIF